MGFWAALRLQKDRDELVTFYDFPAQHWPSIRTSYRVRRPSAMSAASSS